MSDNIQFKPKVQVGIDGAASDTAWADGELVPIHPAQAFEYPEDPEAEDLAEQAEARRAFSLRQTACKILDLLTAGEACAKTVGQRALALQFLLRAGPYPTQKELAVRLEVKQARASQILKSFRVISTAFSRSETSESKVQD